MTDKMTPSQRHLCMSHIRSRNTKPEMLVRQWLWRHGYRYRLNVKGMPGKPDIVMRPYRTAIFVNGCFWHGHDVKLGVDSLKLEVGSLELDVENSKCCKIPQSNREFWLSKIKKNQERDQRNYQTLHDNGWNVIVIWECQLQPKTLKDTMLRVETQLCDNFLAVHKHKTTTYSQENHLPMAAENNSKYISC